MRTSLCIRNRGRQAWFLLAWFCWLVFFLRVIDIPLNIALTFACFFYFPEACLPQSNKRKLFTLTIRIAEDSQVLSYPCVPVFSTAERTRKNCFFASSHLTFNDHWSLAEGFVPQLIVSEFLCLTCFHVQCSVLFTKFKISATCVN